MIIYALLIVIFTEDGPATIDHIFPDQFDCQVSEGAILTKARDTKEVVGWSVPVECKAVPENNKV